MERVLKSFLFTKGILVCEVGGRIKDPVSREMLESRFGMVIPEEGVQLPPKILPFIEAQLGGGHVDGFYQHFPASVRQLPPHLLQYEQTCHYLEQKFCTPLEIQPTEHSALETEGEKLSFDEVVTPKIFRVLTEKEAKAVLESIIEDMLSSPYPLSMMHHQVLKTFVHRYNYDVKKCVCKNTAIHLLLDTRNLKYADFLTMSDVLKVAKLLSQSHDVYPPSKHIKLPNQDRKFVTSLLDYLFEHDRCDMETCFEKKAMWQGLLHHIHYQAKNDMAEQFLTAMRGSQNQSAYARVEAFLSQGDVCGAVQSLYDAKGSDGVLKHLVYLVSQCRYEKEVAEALKAIHEGSVAQLLSTYHALLQIDPQAEQISRDVAYTKQGKQFYHHLPHTPTKKYPITPKRFAKMQEAVQKRLKQKLAKRLGRVYISPEMYDIALPWQGNDTMYGYGTLPKGSRVVIPEDKKIRAFVLWQGMHDVDLSVIGLTDEGEQVEFSWRTMHNAQSEAIAYSGDALQGQPRRAEYIDVDMEAFARVYPHVKYLIFCQNAYTGKHFDRFECRAGYMLRDKTHTGEVFEPKTVKAVFDVTGKSTFVYLFALDLEKHALLWLGSTQAMDARVANKANLSFVKPCLSATESINMGWLFEQMATQVVSEPQEAQMVVGDCVISPNPLAERILTCDIEKIQALLFE